MNEVTIGHQGTLIFRVENTSGSRNGLIENLTVTAHLPGLQATKDVWDFDGWSGLLSFFEELASNWRGWDGEKNFDSIEGDFRLAAKHDGHIRLALELRESDRSTPWTANGELTLDPGEELTAAAESLRDLLAGTRH
ncbi:DUF6228 family protein [Paenarthrobacter nicotinovorans]|uniref:DUF6228 family protein n=1 Tax=Paenarthrobacter nicotinovorans TaxID=29320 RepID=UPI00380F3863